MNIFTENPVILAAVVTLVLFLGGMVLLGIRAQRYNKTFDDTISAGRATTFLMCVGSGIGAQIGSGYVMGGAEHGAAFGIGGAWYGMGCGIGYILMGLLSARYFHRRGFISMGDYLADRYNDMRVSILYILSMLMCSFSVVAGQLLAGRAILEAFGVPGGWSTWITIGVAFVFATLTGLWGAFAASALQSVVILAGILLAVAVMIGQNGLAILPAALPEMAFDMLPYDPETFVGILFPVVTIMLTGQMNVQRAGSSDTERTAVWGHILAGIILIVIAFVPALLGMYGRILYPQAPDNVVFTALLMNYLPTVISGILLATIMSSIISAFCGNSVMMNTMIFHDIYRGLMGRTISDRATRFFMVGGNLVICIVAVLLTHVSEDIIGVMSLGYTFCGSGCIVAIFGGMLWKRPSGAAAALSIICSVSVSMLHLLGVIHIPYQSLVTLGIALVVYLAAGSLLPAGSVKRA